MKIITVIAMRWAYLLELLFVINFEFSKYEKPFNKKIEDF